MPEIDDTSRDPWNLAGTTIEAKYRIASVIGDGGFGVVYRGVHLGFNEVIAVKCLKLPHALGDDQRQGFLEQLREEGRLLHRLSKATPGIVQALDVGALTAPSGAWVPYLVLEWLDGETLADHLQKRAARGGGPFPLEEAIRLLEPAARALGVAHALKVAHRDVKPQNLFVAKVGDARTIKVLDFGIAKVLTDYTTMTAALDSTRQTPTAFTPRYGAPEQFNKQRGATGPWTDVFALALILVELLTGKKALEGDDPTQLYVASADPTMRPTPQALGVPVPDAVEAVIERALAVEPKNRFADAEAMWDALLDAAGLSPLNTMRVSSSGAAHTVKTESGAGDKTVVDRVPPTRDERAAPAEHPLDATRPVEALGGASPGSVVVKPDPTATAASPGLDGGDPQTPGPAGARRRAAVDPMSETPFFERHHLPPSQPVPPQADAPAKAMTAPGAPAPARSRRPLFALALVLTAGGALAAWQYASSFQVELKPNPTPNASAPKKKSSPPRRPAPPLVSATAVPTASASTPLDAGPTEPPPPPTDMVFIAPGTFKLGEGGREVTLTRGYYIDRTEVTATAYERCTAKRMCAAAEHVTLPDGTPERWAPGVDPEVEAGADGLRAQYIETWSRRCNAPRSAGDHPINCVDFASAEAYCRWVGKRLPTEAEWEVAARGAESRVYPWGAEAPECGRACYDKNGSCRGGGQDVATCAAGLHPADRTPDGVYDLGGDVSEWVSDGFTDAVDGGADPKGDRSSGKRVVRGGSFIDGEGQLKAASRAGAPPGLSHVAIGFRCAMDAPAAKP